MGELYRFFSSFSVLVRMKKWIDGLFYALYWLRKKIRVRTRKWTSFPSIAPAYIFAILCVKRVEYVDLAIRNINSLHFHNPRHTCVIFADTTCSQAFASKRRLLDYPEVTALRTISPKGEPWQYTKVDALIRASSMGAILIDADSFWYSTPEIDTGKITLLVSAYTVGDNEFESQIVRRLFRKKALLSYTHYVTGFVSIPKRFMTPKFQKRLRAYVRKLYESPLNFLPNEETRQSFRRLAEEMATSYVSQEMVPQAKITTLKTTDGPGDRKIMQSLYYGCSNQIIG